MIVDSTDPTANGLFSRCGRSHAAKNRSTHEAAPYEPRSRKPLQIAARKVNNSLSTFDMLESREQRQKRDRPEDTPPVGIYKTVRPERPKMVWDIVKVFHSSHKGRSNSNKKSIRGTLKGIEPKPEQAKRPRTLTFAHPHPSYYDDGKRTCLVDMNRTTGRRPTEVSDLDWGETDLIEAVSKIKQKLTKNIVFAKERAARPHKNEANYTTGYNYDYRVLKPRRSALVDFGVLKGRESGHVKTEGNYSYQHYDYEGVGSVQASTVFPNTKTHLIGFDKQLDRYGKAYTEESAN